MGRLVEVRNISFLNRTNPLQFPHKCWGFTFFNQTYSTDCFRPKGDAWIFFGKQITYKITDSAHSLIARDWFHWNMHANIKTTQHCLQMDFVWVDFSMNLYYLHTGTLNSVPLVDVTHSTNLHFSITIDRRCKVSSTKCCA